MKYRMLALIILLVISALTSNAQPILIKQYCNARFGYCLNYDASILKPLPEAHNGDGRVFQDAKGREILRVYGSGDWNYGIDGEVISLAALYRK